MSAILALLVFLALILCGYAAAVWAREQGESRDALDRRLATMAGTTPIGTSRGTLLKDERLSGIAVLNSLLGRVSLVRPLVKTIRQAGLKRRAGEVLLYIPLLACLAFLITILVGGPVRVGILLAVVAAVLPIVIVRRMRTKRMLLFAEQLPNALDLLRAALQAGHGLLTAIQVVADEFPDPIAQELREVGDEVRLGLPFRDAMYHLTDRIDDPNLPILVVGILIAQEVGGNLAEVLDNITYTIRERFKLLREIRVMTAQGRLSGGVLTALPFLVATCLLLFNAEYFRPMIETKTGIYMMGYGILSIALGHLVIQRIVRIKV